MLNHAVTEYGFSKTLSEAWKMVAQKKVMVAEDDRGLRGLLVLTLQREGFDVVEAADGVGALRVALETAQTADQLGSFDLIVSDVRMPGKSGLDVLVTLREAGLRVPVILITAFPDRDVCEQAVQWGAQILDKPFELTDFRRLANRALACSSP